MAITSVRNLAINYEQDRSQWSRCATTASAAAAAIAAWGIFAAVGYGIYLLVQ